MTKFRPCIDLHQGQVKQIVGGTLREGEEDPETNFVSEHSPRYYAELYHRDGLTGGHVIKLGPGNESAALQALRGYPNGLQLGGGVTVENAGSYLEEGASHVIVTSLLFDSAGHFKEAILEKLVTEIGKERLVLDLSCRRTENGWQVTMNRWQTLTELAVDETTLRSLSGYAAEFLIHAADVEGKCGGIDEELVCLLGQCATIPTTYAGGARNLDDLRLVHELSGGRVDLTIGSALDIFGGRGVTYEECVAWNRRSN